MVWQVLTHRIADKEAHSEKVAGKLIRWGYHIRTAGRRGLSGGEFVRRELERLGLGRELSQFSWERRIISLPPPPD